MFGTNNRGYGNNGGSINGSKGEIVKSGYSVQAGLEGLGDLRNDFAEALQMDSQSDISEEQIYHFASKEGELRGATELFKRQSKQQLNAAKAAKKLQNAVFQHVNQAASLESQWRQSEQKNLEKLSGTMLDLNTTVASHDGFASYLDVADGMVNY